MTLESNNLSQRIKNTDSKLRETMQYIVVELEIGSKCVQDNIAQTFEHIGNVQAELLHILGQEYQKYQVDSSESIEQLKKSDLALSKVTTEFEKDIASLLSKHANEREALLRDVKNAVTTLENDIDTLTRVGTVLSSPTALGRYLVACSQD